ncbi:TetR/AcrR family transcriptional regulator [Lysobacter sp. GX 14042]|uniref:TetR/AcrR family transcriptional regulator n=1 Tax=Lysobacter sp. GX 14042 TaxID=2907155 RepID=UPI001F325767|nr:TetR/AcrR family transcriptional regulator [Lysobacter sp. GX 14042]MCE7033401.1 TetR/AcrR family transcriptional regulator [Lysobacter sp. GX 14042]
MRDEPVPAASPEDTAPSPAARGPGRPKDLAKRAAILQAGTVLFVDNGYEGTSMEAVAAAAGVSKLTVYSHFGNKQGLFVAAVQAHCERMLPDALFARAPETPLAQRLHSVARAVHALCTSPEAIAASRVLGAPGMAGSQEARLYWDAGPARLQADLEALLARRSARGELRLDPADAQTIATAASQFIALLTGPAQVRLVLGCDPAPVNPQTHIAAAVATFLRAWAADPPAN